MRRLSGTGPRIGALLLVAATLGACERTPKAPDVVLLVVDTLRAKSLSTYGYGRDTSPNLSGFAADAITYEAAVTTGTWTVPTHGSLFTGLMPSYHGAERVPADRTLATPINPDVTTLAEVLASRGYRTGAFVANETYVTASLGFARGFQAFVPADVLADDTIGRALDWFGAQPRPTFLFINVLDPHEPYEPPAPYRERFPGRRADLGTKLTDLYWDGVPLTPDLLAHFRSQYDGEIAYTDRILGDFFERLRVMERYEEALLIVTSDHGEILGEHQLAGHGCAPFEELLHVPLLVKLPGNRRAGTRVERRVSTLGVFAQILAVTGIPVPDGIQSVPLDEAHRVWVEDVDNDGRRVTVGYEGNRKLVHRVDPGGANEWSALYDLDSDAGEGQPIEPQAGAALRGDLERFRTAPRPTNAAAPPRIDPERERKLRELGYLR